MASGTTVVEPTPVLDLARSPGLRDEVVVAIERAVLVGALAPGQRLVEIEIARQMGISKAPVREALRELERLGLVVSYPRRGTFVSVLTPTVASETFSLRTVVECYAGRLAVSRHSEADLALMDGLLARADSLSGSSGDERLYQQAELDLAFHDQIYRLSGHALLQETWGNLRARVRLLLVATGLLREDGQRTGRGSSYRRGHEPILAALRARDPDRMEVATVRHLADGERGLVQRLAGDTSALRVEAEALARRPDLAHHLVQVAATDAVADAGSFESGRTDTVSPRRRSHP